MSSTKTFFGHPRGLATLFFTEMWERFSFYGMRALLLLFMIASVEQGGLGIDEKTGGAIYGLYTMLVYLFSLPGGWLADKLFGLRRAVFYGGCLIAIGHFCLAISSTEMFFVGLLFIVIGTGLLKPNISSMVGQLYSSDQQAMRDAGFSIFYMGINIGATIAPIITSYLGETINWHYGFAAAGVGMVVGLIQYKLTDSTLGNIGLPPVATSVSEINSQQRVKSVLWIVIGLLVLLVGLAWNNIITFNPVVIATFSIYAIGGCAVLYFSYVLIFEELSPAEKSRIKAIAMFFVASCIFYFGYEQQGSSLTLFANRYTDRFIGNFEFPSGWFQTIPAVGVIIFAPLFAWLWVSLSRKKLNPAIPVKLAFGLIFIGLGYLIMMGASYLVVQGAKPLPTWLIITYVLHTFGEICLYPIGLSAVSRLAPAKLTGQMMGIWFMSLAFGNLAGGLFSGNFDDGAIRQNPQLMVSLFGQVTAVTIGAGLVVVLLTKLMKRFMDAKDSDKN
jgi:proton-dependent oligopeptide transporter, POT family